MSSPVFVAKGIFSVRGIKTKNLPCMRHVRRKICGRPKTTAIGMSYIYRAGVQMQTIFQLPHAFGGRSAIFEVADDGRADVGEMGAQLMRAAGHRSERNPGILVSSRA